ncbi:hypothetical protein [Chamaesiphon sp.]|uniref:hypothetical protein n=1 Tax=Chamaesiphon sp. TaxID=2814140 RepID=UPI003592FFC9
MNASSCSIGLLSLATLAALVALPVPHVSAQCVMSDINFQSSINGSGKPTNRTNDVKQGSTGGCVGNSVNTTNVQSQTGGTDRATQRRQSTQQINGSNNSPTGVNLDPVKIKTNVQVDVDNPADRLRR